MTAIVGPERFAAARRAAAQDAVREACVVRDAAFAVLIEARAAFAEEAEERYASGARLAARDSDRMEAIATRLVAFLDGLQADLDRLDIARDVSVEVGFAGLRFTRSGWDRPALSVAVADALQPLFDPSAAAAVLCAAVRLESLA